MKPYVALLDAHNKALMEETRRRKRGDKNTNVTTSGSPSLLFAVNFGCCFITHEERACTQVGDDRACLVEGLLPYLRLPSCFVTFRALPVPLSTLMNGKVSNKSLWSCTAHLSFITVIFYSRCPLGKRCTLVYQHKPHFARSSLRLISRRFLGFP